MADIVTTIESHPPKKYHQQNNKNMTTNQQKIQKKHKLQQNINTINQVYQWLFDVDALCVS